ncbi:MAG TPA: TadE/TadG family type IV pilus assembly protein [Aestuariivirga sp.]
MNVLPKLKSVLKRFACNQKGSMSIVVAVAAIPMLVAIGSAVDIERAINARTALQSSLDSAALYAATLNDTTSAALTSDSKIYVTNNYLNNSDAQVSNYAVTNNGSTLTASAQVTLNTTFMTLVGIKTVNVSAKSTVLRQGINLEVSLVLDNTTSMAGQAMTDAKAAANLFVSMVPPQPVSSSSTTYTKIALVPYNNAVNLGTTANANYAHGAYKAGTSTTAGYQNFKFNNPSNTTMTFSATSASGLSTCVTERTSPVAARSTDVSPYNSSGVLVAPFGFMYGPSGNDCSVTAVVPLSTTAAPLTTAISAMSAAGSTAGQVGIAWGWYALSPTVGIWSGSSVPGAYSVTVGNPAFISTTPNLNQVHKVMILMTDGEYNSAYDGNGVISSPSSLSGSGSTSNQSKVASPIGDSYTQASQMCTAIKAAGVELYVVTFQLTPAIRAAYPNRPAFVNACATDANHVVDADSTSPSAAFAKIANQLNAMRIQS